tara:strand:+ start:242 stop:568 length:327 start_codon:yes stop_codon:yes gene_type:complete
MNQTIATKVSLFILFVVSLTTLSVFGSLGVSVQTCNIDEWFQLVEPVLGHGVMGAVKTVWVTLLIFVLLPFAQSFMVKGRLKLVLLIWSCVVILVLILVRSAELAPNC